ncbi:hypothetical protein [Streptosporangium sp. NPDC051022]|uniref:hypothetical protein n=1 Tax=Streptosporangium sp. NPDC051022 TaxID=3155752 RepID=UPI003448E02B
MFTAALFLGHFIRPLPIVALTAAVGGLGGALILIGLLALVPAAATRGILTRRAPATV